MDSKLTVRIDGLDIVNKLATYNWTMDFLLRQAIQYIRDGGDPFRVADKLEDARVEAHKKVGFNA
jgi:hypothetical protein